jgi:hypothetical protein
VDADAKNSKRGEIRVETLMIDRPDLPVYLRIAQKAKHLRELGMSDRAIARTLGVSDKTVAKSSVPGAAHREGAVESSAACDP